MRILHSLHNTTLHFVQNRYYAYTFSCVLLLLGLGGILWRGGIPLGVDFQGGSLLQISFDHPIQQNTLMNSLATLQVQDLTIQTLNNSDKEYLIRFSANKPVTQEDVIRHITTTFPDIPYTIERFESVGSKISDTMRTNALEALYYAVLIIAVYISGRFEGKWFSAIGIAVLLSGIFFVFTSFHFPLRFLLPIVLIATLILFAYAKLAFALAGIIALIHDVCITIGILVLCNISFDLTIVSALLAIIGYSLNDTIIIFDRIRENFSAAQKKGISINTIIDTSITSTLSRTILTSATTLFVLASLLIFGGTILFPFALTLFIGTLIGTYSSIFIASPILLLFNVTNIQNTTTKKILKIDENGVV